MLPFMDEKLDALAADICVMDATMRPFMECATTGPDASCTLMCPFIASIVISPEIPSTEMLPFIVLRSSAVCFGTLISILSRSKSLLNVDDIVLPGGFHGVVGLIQPVHSGRHALPRLIAWTDAAPRVLDDGIVAVIAGNLHRAHRHVDAQAPGTRWVTEWQGDTLWRGRGVLRHEHRSHREKYDGLQKKGFHCSLSTAQAALSRTLGFKESFPATCLSSVTAAESFRTTTRSISAICTSGADCGTMALAISVRAADVIAKVRNASAAARRTLTFESWIYQSSRALWNSPPGAIPL